MHPRNRHQGLYDFPFLTRVSPELIPFVVNRYGKESIEFMDPAAVRALNRALLKAYYKVSYWDIPEDFLCPPIPGRADYVHTVADLLLRKEARVLDVGTGANVIYPLIGHAEYGWKFVGTEIHPRAVANARRIVSENKLSDAIKIQEQTSGRIFQSIIGGDDFFDLTMCNPPFHASAAEALAGTARKWKNLNRGKPGSHRNFGGQGNELWCEGGEKQFISRMITESKAYEKSVGVFTTLVSKEANLRYFEKILKSLGDVETRVLEMAQGAKKSRVLAWSFQAKIGT